MLTAMLLSRDYEAHATSKEPPLGSLLNNHFLLFLTKHTGTPNIEESQYLGLYLVHILTTRPTGACKREL
jgi:hypothetical protein